ncbi:alpha/beta hydrolase [Nocardia sp. NPDC056611]|uniref:alpha/beta hydrolase n=1 Tax=Nocardia sp. NPDC056611 TaxID=3345877 RepID=UPI00366F2086
MLDYATDLVKQNDVFVSMVDQMEQSVDNAMNHWKGAGAAAASERAVAHKLHGNHLATTIVGIADHYNTYGAQLGDTRTSLLKILDTELPAAGMTVDDDGNVTAPKVPSDPDHPLTGTAALLQQTLDGQASGFQSRIKALLFQFGMSEISAKTAISADLQLLGGYETKPDGAPISSSVQDILDGNSELPSDPRKLHDLWESLTPAEKDALYEKDNYIGNRDGLPTVDRDHYNREKLDDELTRAQNGDPALKDKLADLQGIATALNGSDRYLMLMDTQSGSIPHAAIAAGNPDTASNVCTYVPGTTSRPSAMNGTNTINGDMPRVDAMRQQAQKSGAPDTSVVAWFGYDAPPELLNATHVSYADKGAPALDRFQDGLRASHEGQPSYNTVLGHSYGTTLVGDSASHGRTLNADAVVLVASPGTTVQHASDLSLTGVPSSETPKHVFATKSDADPVALYAQKQEVSPLRWLARHANMDDFGVDPTWNRYGAQSFPSDHQGALGYDGNTHSEYWLPDSKSLRGMGDIIAGNGNEAVKIK